MRNLALHCKAWPPWTMSGGLVTLLIFSSKNLQVAGGTNLAVRAIGLPLIRILLEYYSYILECTDTVYTYSTYGSANSE
jgi:hypothetical protein